MLPVYLTPQAIQLYGSTIVYLINTGKLVGTEIVHAIRSIFRHADPTLTDEQLDAIAHIVQDRAEVREALSRIEAGELPPQ
jgi:hypothetical protein